MHGVKAVHVMLARGVPIGIDVVLLSEFLGLMSKTQKHARVAPSAVVVAASAAQHKLLASTIVPLAQP